MSSFVSQVMSPGGGVMLLPFVRVVIVILLLLTFSAAVVGVARVHMVILSMLSAGLLISLSFFESEYNKLRASRSKQSGEGSTTVSKTSGAQQAKTD
ncbi:hypothetical protein MPSEU_000861900 [Mayamaea pseudoterrestris]|nr:hypothetical protein MPSEU_000861900 [Mayamaea pseudoterrestris]